MPSEVGGVEQAVSRALRDSLEKLQKTTEELNQAIADLVASCSSRRPANALPPIVRAQAAAASLGAALEVLSRFVTAALHTAQRAPVEEEVLPVVSLEPPEAPPEPQRPGPSLPVPMAESPLPPAPAQETSVGEVSPVVEMAQDVADVELIEAPAGGAQAAEQEPVLEDVSAVETPEEEISPAEAEAEAEVAPAAAEAAEAGFDVSRLPVELQELHRRANRVAKVSMQDIKLLRPDQVRLGREHKDICVRLRNEIEKAHKEYDRRFRPILDHPVDYFYAWMVQILADGDPEALGKYPYPSPVVRR